MTYLKIVIFTALIYKSNSSELIASKFAVNKNCSIIKTYKVGEQKIERIQSLCCNGYQNYDEQLCIPVCSKTCGDYGVCSSPEVCSCKEGYIIDKALHECRPFCDLTCEIGSCIAPNVCSCQDGYRWSQKEAGWSWNEPDCKPICDNCPLEETCIEPHVCKCKQGYTRAIMDRPEHLHMPKCTPVCDQPCINSRCVEPNHCQCHKNYDRIDKFTCDVRMYVASDFAIPKNCTKTVLEKQKKIKSIDSLYYDENTKKYNSATDYEIELVLVNKTINVCCDGYQNLDDEKCIPVCNRSCGIFGICSAPNACTCYKGFTLDENSQLCKP